MDTTTTSPDPVALLAGLTAEQVRDRLDALDAEARALRVLLRSLQARDRAALRRRPEEVRRGA
jgi:hypothetical protein